jgi:hypothetical protein
MVAKWICHDGYMYRAAHIGPALHQRTADTRQPPGSSFRIIYRPVGNRVITRCNACYIGIQPQFEATNIETDIKRLVEIRLNAGGLYIPLFGGSEVADMINYRSKLFEQGKELQVFFSLISLYIGYVFLYFLLLVFFADHQYILGIHNDKIFQPL